MKEIWKVVKDFDKYEVSNLGNVRNKETRKLKKISIRKRDGYCEVSLQSNEKKQYTKCVHVLVANAFIENLDNKYTINRIDGNKLNNRVDNLEWCSTMENNLHKYYVLGKGVKKVRCVDTNTIYKSIQEASRITKTSAGDICMCCKKLRNEANGHVWEYA